MATRMDRTIRIFWAYHKISLLPEPPTNKRFQALRPKRPVPTLLLQRPTWEHTRAFLSHRMKGASLTSKSLSVLSFSANADPD